MERYAWKATVLPGKLEEYIHRHDNIWPEMKEVLAAAGIRNYTIWNVGQELFGYYECDSVEYAAKVQAEEKEKKLSEAKLRAQYGDYSMLRALGIDLTTYEAELAGKVKEEEYAKKATAVKESLFDVIEYLTE